MLSDLNILIHKSSVKEYPKDPTAVPNPRAVPGYWPIGFGPRAPQIVPCFAIHNHSRRAFGGCIDLLFRRPIITSSLRYLQFFFASVIPDSRCLFPATLRILELADISNGTLTAIWFERSCSCLSGIFERENIQEYAAWVFSPPLWSRFVVSSRLVFVLRWMRIIISDRGAMCAIFCNQFSPIYFYGKSSVLHCATK